MTTTSSSKLNHFDLAAQAKLRNIWLVQLLQYAAERKGGGGGGGGFFFHA